MGEIFIYFVDHFGITALVLLFGFLADKISTPHFKSIVAGWIKRRGAIPLDHESLSRTLRLFLTDFLYKIYSPRVWSVRFFARSAIVSVIVFALVVLIQFWAKPNAREQFTTISPTFATAAMIVLILLISNLILDYLSNAQSVSLLRMAANSGRLVDVLVILWADIVLTVALFSLIFPIGIVISIFATEGLQQPIVFEISRPDTDETRMSEQIYKPILTEAPFLNSLSIATLELKFDMKDSFFKIDSPSRSQILFVKKGRSTDEIISDFAAIMKSFPVETKVLSVSPGKMQMEARVPPLPFNWDLIKHFYYAGYQSANVAREAFLLLVRLDPVRIPTLGLINYVAMYTYAKEDLVYTGLCPNGEISKSKLTLDTNADLNFSCEPTMVYLGNPLPAQDWFIRNLRLGGTQFPVTPFFYTSFSLSLLYYSIIAIVCIALAIKRALTLVFSSRYFETDSYPFSILCLLLYIPLVLISLAYRVV